MALYKMDEWQNASGSWMCEYTGHITCRGTQLWVVPARILGITPAEFLVWLLTKYKPDIVNHNKDCSFVSWAWKDQTAMRKYKNDMNKMAREKNFQV